MIGWLLQQFGGYLLIAGAALVGIVSAYIKGGRDKELKHKAKEADAYAKHLEDIKNAAVARGNVNIDPDRLRDDDGYKRKE